MNTQIERYNKIVNDLVKTSFPELGGKKIIVFNLKSRGLFGLSIPFFPFVGFLGINKSKTKSFSQTALSGLIAHELCHFSIIENNSFIKNILYFWKLPFSKKVRADFERKAGLLAIEKGYSKDLILLKMEDAKGRTAEDLENKYSRGYLSPKEIKYLIKKKQKKFN